MSPGCPQGARNPFHEVHEDSTPCMTVHSPATGRIQTTDDPDDARNPVATGQETTQCRCSALGAGIRERTFHRDPKQ